MAQKNMRNLDMGPTACVISRWEKNSVFRKFYKMWPIWVMFDGNMNMLYGQWVARGKSAFEWQCGLVNWKGFDPVVTTPS